MFDQFSSDPQENLLSSVSLAALNSNLSPENAVIVPTSGLSTEKNLNQPVTVNPADSLLLPGIEGSDTTGAVALVDNQSSDALTGEAMNIAQDKLIELAQAPDFIAKMNIPFGENWNTEVANTLKQNWLNSDFRSIPLIEIVAKGEIAGANGAFAQATNTIYLSQKFLRENGTNSQAVADVLLEEIGHSIDSKINITDSPGDEGEIFAGIVQGKELSSQELLKLKANDDNGIITIGGINLPVEQSRIKKQRDFNGDNISDLLRQEKGQWLLDNVRNAEVYLSRGNWEFKQQSVLMPNGDWMNGNLVNFIYGDFNGDYKTDFIRQEKGGWVDGVNDVQIFISKGDGTFQTPVNMNEMGSMNGNVVNLIVGDFTGGGADDIIRQEKGNWVNGVNDTQFYTYSKGNFVKVKDVPDMAAMNGNYTNLIAGDFDGDGITDLLRQEKGQWLLDNVRNAEVYLSRGNWEFKQQSVLPNGDWMNGNLVNFIPGYFNADNKTDLIRQEKGGWVNGVNDVQILISKGDGTFQNPVNMNDMGMMNGNVANLIVGDFTGGGVDDIIRQSNNSGDAQFYTWSAGNFRKVGNVPDMAAMNGNFVNLAPKIDGASSYPYAPPPGQTQVPASRLTSLSQKSSPLTIDEIREYRQLVSQRPETERAGFYKTLQVKVPYFNQNDNASTENGARIGYKMCNVTTLASCLTYLGVKNPNPSKQFEDSLEDILRANPTIYTSFDTSYNPREFGQNLSKLATNLGVASSGKNWIPGFDITNVNFFKDYVKNNWEPSLKQGKAIMSEVETTPAGHILKVLDIDWNRGGIIVDDPYGRAQNISGDNANRDDNYKNPTNTINPNTLGAVNTQNGQNENGNGNDNFWDWNYCAEVLGATWYYILG